MGPSAEEGTCLPSRSDRQSRPGKTQTSIRPADSERSAPSRSKMSHTILLIFNFSLFIEMYFSYSMLHPMCVCSSLDGSRLAVVSVFITL